MYTVQFLSTESTFQKHFYKCLKKCYSDFSLIQTTTLVFSNGLWLFHEEDERQENRSNIESFDYKGFVYHFCQIIHVSQYA